jgi:hypothetical protein
MNMMSMMPVLPNIVSTSALQQAVQTFITNVENVLGLSHNGQLNTSSLVTLIEADFLFMALTGRML